MKKEPTIFIKDIDQIRMFLMEEDLYKEDYYQGYKSAR